MSPVHMTYTLVLGASQNPQRYSNLAVTKLRANNIEVIAIGLRKGKIGDVDILDGKVFDKSIETVTLYLNAERQKPYYNYILSLNCKRIIFNPGAENPELMSLAKAKGIECLNACTLVMLNIGTW